MFTLMAIAVVVACAFFAGRMAKRDQRGGAPPMPRTQDEVDEAIVHTRQDLRLVAVLLAGVIVMLGVIADRIG